MHASVLGAAACGFAAKQGVIACFSGRGMKKNIVNVGVMALARECGLSASAVSKKMKAGQTVAQIRQAAARRKGIPPPNKQGPGRPPATKTEYDLVLEGRERADELDIAKLRRAKALAERQEIENLLRKGELLPVVHVRQFAGRVLVETRDELLRSPSELADLLAAETDPIKVAAILRGAHERALAKLEQLNRLWQGTVEAEQVA
jgi:hypothetical protein